MEQLKQLSYLIKARNEIGKAITSIINRPAEIGHIGEYIAACIFDIKLKKSANNKSFDGYFSSGNLKGKTVNIKWSTKHDRCLNLNKKEQPDFYLVITGKKEQPRSSYGLSRPIMIEYIFLFRSKELLDKLNVKIGNPTSIRKELWEQTEIYPTSKNDELALSEKQKTFVELFTSSE